MHHPPHNPPPTATVRPQPEPNIAPPPSNPTASEYLIPGVGAPTMHQAPPTAAQAPPTGAHAPPTGTQAPPTGAQALPTGAQAPPTQRASPLEELIRGLSDNN